MRFCPGLGWFVGQACWLCTILWVLTEMIRRLLSPAPYEGTTDRSTVCPPACCWASFLTSARIAIPYVMSPRSAYTAKRPRMIPRAAGSNLKDTCSELVVGKNQCTHGCFLAIVCLKMTNEQCLSSLSRSVSHRRGPYSLL